MRIFAFWLLSASAALADPIEVPQFSDGTVDVGTVLSSFEIESETPLSPNADHRQFSGSMLGETFRAVVSEDVHSGAFTLSIGTPNLTEQAVYITAVLLIDVVCLNRNRGVEPLNWAASSMKVGTEWQVNASCSIEPRIPIQSSN
ncbi:MAG: hypothetical protein ABJ327_10285 [Litoreibacter sp.]